MRRIPVLVSAAALGVGVVSAVTLQAASASTVASKPAHPSHAVLHVHEQSAGAAFLDLGAKGPSFGDELVGANKLLGVNGKTVGSDSFVCVTVLADDSANQCTATYTLSGGRITAQGYAKIVGSHPLFNEQFAITGGTGRFSRARGEVRVLQSSETNAELYFALQH